MQDGNPFAHNLSKLGIISLFLIYFLHDDIIVYNLVSCILKALLWFYTTVRSHLRSLIMGGSWNYRISAYYFFPPRSRFPKQILFPFQLGTCMIKACGLIKASQCSCSCDHLRFLGFFFIWKWKSFRGRGWFGSRPIMIFLFSGRENYPHPPPHPPTTQPPSPPASSSETPRDMLLVFTPRIPDQPSMPTMAFAV